MRVVSAKDVARALVISEARVYEIARKRLLPEACIIRIGRQIRFNLDEVELWARSGGSTLSEGRGELTSARGAVQ